VTQESRSTRGKAIFGLAIVGALVAAGLVWFLTQRGTKTDEVAMLDDTLSNIEVDGGLNATGKKTGGGKRVVGRGPGGVPILSGGMSCESAQNAYIEEMSVGGPRGQADITGGQYGSILNRGTYFGHCGVPSSTGLNICAAVQNGKAVGVTVVAKPRNRGIESCVAASVRGLGFPSHPKLDVTRTTF
jgi:hypothetical protein